jgi:predicted Zn-dependent peptidase
VTAGLIPLQRAGIFTVTATVKPGVDPALVSKRLDQILADYIAKGPTQDEIQRAVMSEVSGRIRGLEQVGGFGGKAVTLAEGQTYAHDSNFYKKTLASYASVTPSAVRTAMQQWLRRPGLTILLSPGERSGYKEPKPVVAATAGTDKTEGAVKGNRPIPPVGQLAALDFPTIEHDRLSNGIPIEYVQRNAVPLTQMAMVFDAGDAADAADSRGLAALTMNLMDEATKRLSSQELAEAEERLGADVSTSNTSDRSVANLSALSPNLAPSLDLLADVVRDPAFAPAEIERVKAQTLTGIAQFQRDPTRVGSRLLPVVLFGPAHPYGGPAGGDPKAIARLTKADLTAFQQRWIRPDNAKIFIVSSLPLSEVKPLLEARFGNWAPPAAAKGVKTFTAPPPRPAAQKILLINRPGAPQASITGGQLLPFDPRGDIVPLFAANDIVAGNFLSRINMDLRETKGWSYGVSGRPNLLEKGVSYVVSAPVQADKTGEALAALNAQFADFLSSKGVSDEELQRTIAKSINELPGRFETSDAVLNAMLSMDLFGRPDNYYETLAAEYRSQTAATLDKAARSVIDPRGFTWVVVGDAAKIRPQLEKLGLPIEVVEAP